jgi:hypothetical protein
LSKIASVSLSFFWGFALGSDVHVMLAYRYLWYC